MQTEYEYECKVTARVDRELYNAVQEHFHHGQQTNFFRNVFQSLKILIKENRFDEVTDYLYKDEPLVLPNTKNLKG